MYSLKVIAALALVCVAKVNSRPGCDSKYSCPQSQYYCLLQCQKPYPSPCPDTNLPSSPILPYPVATPYAVGSCIVPQPLILNAPQPIISPYQEASSSQCTCSDSNTSPTTSVSIKPYPPIVSPCIPFYPEPIYPKPYCPEPIYPKPYCPEPCNPEPCIPEPCIPEPCISEPCIPEPYCPEPCCPPTPCDCE